MPDQPLEYGFREHVKAAGSEFEPDQYVGWQTKQVSIQSTLPSKAEDDCDEGCLHGLLLPS